MFFRLTYLQLVSTTAAFLRFDCLFLLFVICGGLYDCKHIDEVYFGCEFMEMLVGILVVIQFNLHVVFGTAPPLLYGQDAH